MTAYYNLRRYMPAVTPSYVEAIRHSTAVVAGGTWSVLPLEVLSPEVRANLGMAPMPGKAFVGGSHLVVSRNSPYPELAVQLAIHLATPSAQLQNYRQRGSLPTSLEALNSPEFQAAPFSAPMIAAIQGGRSLPGNFSLWGLIEDRLTAALAQIWQTLLAQPHADTATVIRNIVAPLSQRLQLLVDQERPRPLTTL